MKLRRLIQSYRPELYSGLAGIIFGMAMLTGYWVGVTHISMEEPVFSTDKSGSEQPTVWVLFQRADCVGAMWKIEGWEALYRRGIVHVEGWALDPPSTKLPSADPIEQIAVSFPLRRHYQRQVIQRLGTLGFSQTPVVVVVDENGRVRMAIPGDEIESLEHIEAIANFAESLSS